MENPNKDNLGWNDTASTPEGRGKSGKASAMSHSGDDFDLLLCLRVLLSYWWILAPLLVLGAAVGSAIWVYSLPVYRSYCRFEIIQSSSPILDDMRSRSRSYDNSVIMRHILVMQSSQMNRKIRQELNQEFAREIPQNFDRYKVNITPVKDTDSKMIDITIDSFSKKYSLSYLNKIIENYQKVRLEEIDLLNSSNLTNLRTELSELSKKLDAAQSDVAQFEAQHHIYFINEKTKSDKTVLTTLMNRQSQMRSQLAILESQFPFLKDENAATLRNVLDLTNQLNRLDMFSEESAKEIPQMNTEGKKVNLQGWSEIPEWSKNEALIIRLSAEYENLLSIYKPNHIRMRKLSDQIAAAKKELQISAEISLKRLQSIRDALRMQEQALLKTAEEFKVDIDLTASERAEYEKLKSREDRLKKNHDQVFTRIIDSSATTTDYYYSRFVDGPLAFEEPIWPVRWKIITMSIFGFVSFGAALILLSYFVKAKLYDYHSLEENLDLPCLAGVPNFKKSKVDKKNPVDSTIVLKDKNDFASECYRSLRTNIEQNLRPGQNLILVTSPDPGEGKTFTVINLGVVFSWNHKKVLLIDGDFRRMTLRKFFKNSTQNGLSDCLTAENLAWKSCVVKSDLPNIDYLPAGNINKHITELLTLPKLSLILKEIGQEYDIVILDSAPVNRVVDTIILAKHVQNVILVARAGKTKTHSLRYCYSRLGMANIVGYILNNIDAASRKYGYYNYGYSYYSTYHQYNTYYKSYSGDAIVKKEV